MVMLVLYKLHGFLTPVFDSSPPSRPKLIFAWISFELGIFLKGSFSNVCRVSCDLNDATPLSFSFSALWRWPL